MFRFTEPSSGQFLKHTIGTFTEHAHPYCLQIKHVAKFLIIIIIIIILNTNICCVID